MEHGQQDAEPIGTILSGIATLLRELSDQLDIAAARVDDTTGLDARLKKLESWAAAAGQDITSLQSRMDKVDPAGNRLALAARPTRAERREAAERAELEAAASRGDEISSATSPAASDPASSTPASGTSTSSDPLALSSGPLALSSETLALSSETLALSSATDDEAGGSADASTQAGRRKSVAEAPGSPPRLAPIPRLPAPDLAAEPAGVAAAPENSQRSDTSVPGRDTSLGERATTPAPNRKLPRANFPRRQPARAESDGGSGSGLLGNAGPLSSTGSPGSTGPLGDSGLPTQGSDVDPSTKSETNGAGKDILGSGEPRRRRNSNGTGDSAAPADDSTAVDVGIDRLGDPTGPDRIDSNDLHGNVDRPGYLAAPDGTDKAGKSNTVDDEDQAGSEVGRRSARGSEVTESPAVTAGTSGLPGTPVESDAHSPAAVHSGDTASADTAQRPVAPSGLPERLPGTPSGGSRLPRRAASYVPNAESGSATGESATQSRAERRRLAEAGAAPSDPVAESAHAAPARIPVPTAGTDRSAAHSRPTHDDSGGAETRYAHSTPASEHTASRHSEAVDRPEAAHPAADPAGPAARALGMGSGASERPEAGRGEAVGELAAKRLTDSDAPVTEVIPGLSALRHLGDDSDSPEESPSTGLPQQRGSRRADRRGAGELERSEISADPGARPQSHRAVIEGDGVLPQRDPGTGLPHTGADAGLPRRDTGAGFPQGETGNELPPRDPSSGLPHRDSSTALPQLDSGTGLPQRHSGGGLPQRHSGTGLPAHDTAGGSAGPDIADVLAQRDTGSNLPTRDTDRSLPARETPGGLPQRDSGSALPQRGTSRALPQRDPGHAAPPRDALAEIASDVSVPRSAGRHNSRDDQKTEDLLAEAEHRVDRLRHADSSLHGEAGSERSEQRDSRFEGIRPAGSPAPDSWQGDLDRLAAETAYVDSDPGSIDRPAGADVEPSGAPAVPPALHDWMDQPVPSVESASLPRRGDGPSGVTRRVEPAGITPRPAPAQLNPFGPPTSALTASIDEPAGTHMSFDLDLPAALPEVSSPGSATPAQADEQRPTIEDNAHVDKLQAMLDELKRNPAGPFGRALNTPPENSGH